MRWERHRRPRVLAAVAAALLIVGFLALNAAPRSGVLAAPLDAEEQAFLTLINDYRAQNGLTALSVNSHLRDAATWMSEDMAAKNYFSHTDSLGRNPFQRMAAFGYSYNTWKGENLAAGISTAGAAFGLWKNSPGHNSNMLNPNYKVIGIARAYGAGSTYGWYWTTDFGGYEEPPPPAEAALFIDVPSDHWALPYIEALFDAGITAGCATDPPRYCPSDDVTRAQMAAFIIRALGEDGNLPSYQGYFSDVPPGQWYTGYVERLAQLGVTAGYPNGTYRPNNPVTRSEMAAFILRALGEAGHLPSYRGYFDDVPSGLWYTGFVEHLFEHGITAGCSVSPPLYCPDAAVSRATMAAFIARAWNLPLP